MKEIGVCFPMTCLQANDLLSANSIKKDSVLMELAASMSYWFPRENLQLIYHVKDIYKKLLIVCVLLVFNASAIFIISY